MVDIKGSDNIGGLNQSSENTFTGQKFWFEWIEIPNAPTNLTNAGFDITNGNLLNTSVVYNAGGTDDFNNLSFRNDDLGNDPGNSNSNNDGNNFGIRATTTLNVTTGGTYRFDMRSDDGMMVFVNGNVVVNDNSLHGPRNSNGSIDLTPGQHEIVIIYFERGGQNVLTAAISGPDYTGIIPLQDANVQANAASDTVNAGAGNDTIDAGDGNDVVDAGAGNDSIDGGAGNDTLTGGEGFDTFVVSSGNDTITDFNTGTGQDINDGDQSNNDFLDLDPYYVNLAQARADLADNGILDQSDGSDYSGVAALPGTITLTGISPAELTEDNVNLACFTPGIMIETAIGPLAIETLTVGDMIKTKDNGFQPIRWIGKTTVKGSGRFAPVKITKNTLRNQTDIWVSQQHRFLIKDWRAQLLFGMDEVLITAKSMINDHSIMIDPTDEVTYIHLMFDAHQIIFAAGIETESFHPGQTILDSMECGVRDEIIALFPELEVDDGLSYPTCRPVLRNFEGALLRSYF